MKEKLQNYKIQFTNKKQSQINNIQKINVKKQLLLFCNYLLFIVCNLYFVICYFSDQSFAGELRDVKPPVNYPIGSLMIILIIVLLLLAGAIIVYFFNKKKTTIVKDQ